MHSRLSCSSDVAERSVESCAELADKHWERVLFRPVTLLEPRDDELSILLECWW